MGNCLGSDAKSPSTANTRASNPGPSYSKIGNSSTTTSNTGKPSSISSSTFRQSTGNGGSIDDAFLAGRIQEVPNLRIFSYGEMKNATKNFKPETILGEGGFGIVYKGWVEEKTPNPVKSGLGTVVAIKKLKPESMQGLEEWQSEVNFLGKISHPNIVKLLGYCKEDNELLLVYEFMAMGSLKDQLFRSDSRGAAFNPLSWSLRLKIAIGAARGLAFLHSEKNVIYRDVKTSHILLDSNYNAKLSSFGMAKDGPTEFSYISTRVMGTFGYAAPEYITTGHLYVKSDVYGFGVVLLEMLSGRRAIDACRASGEQNLIDWAQPYLADRKKLARIMDPRLEGRYPLEGALQAGKLTLRCLAGEHKIRPSMTEVVEILEQIEAMK